MCDAAIVNKLNSKTVAVAASCSASLPGGEESNDPVVTTFNKLMTVPRFALYLIAA